MHKFVLLWRITAQWCQLLNTHVQILSLSNDQISTKVPVCEWYRHLNVKDNTKPGSAVQKYTFYCIFSMMEYFIPGERVKLYGNFYLHCLNSFESKCYWQISSCSARLQYSIQFSFVEWFESTGFTSKIPK